MRMPSPCYSISSAEDMGAPLRVATRGSALARWQADRVLEMLGVEGVLVIVSTMGDRQREMPVWDLGGTGVFVKEVEEAVLDGRADVAVHSAKDLPTTLPDGLVIGAFPERADPRDALVGMSFDELPTGARIGTGSVRRRAQLAAARPDLTFASLRGNIETRVAQAGRREFEAVVVAYAALQRLGMEGSSAEALEPRVMLPQVAQGALAVECRADDESTRDLLQPIDRSEVRVMVETERAYLHELGGGCNLPCAALAQRNADGSVTIEVLLASLDGRIVLRTSSVGGDPVAVGRSAARRILDDMGGSSVLEGLAG